MNRYSLAAASVATTVGSAITSVFLCACAWATVVPPGGGDQLTPPPAVTAVGSGISLWWLLAVAATSVIATLMVVAAVRTRSSRPSAPATVALTDQEQDAARRELRTASDPLTHHDQPPG